MFRALENSQHVTAHTHAADMSRLYVTKPALVPIEDFDQMDRERLLELLLSQERVVGILYGSSSPTVNAHGGAAGAKGGAGAFGAGGSKSKGGLFADHSHSAHTPHLNTTNSLLHSLDDALAANATLTPRQQQQQLSSLEQQQLQQQRPSTAGTADTGNINSNANGTELKLPAINNNNNSSNSTRPSTVGTGDRKG